jgi:hydroxymethylpyrimidine pyrophosphatase-like HAD family hydrolase
LTSWLFDNLKEGGKLISYDIDGTINHTNRTDIDFRVESCFDDKPFKDIIELIQSEGRTLVVCDGGNKAKEFNIFSKYLKPNDVIIAHDYCENDIEWKEKTDYWQWPYEADTLPDLISLAIKENNLEPYKYEEMKFLLWASYIKK